jgi:RNA polymerase sigma factor (sigma-70 family)
MDFRADTVRRSASGRSRSEAGPRAALSEGDVLSWDDAWQLCLRRQRRLLLAAARMGLAEQAEDLVHDTFVQAMQVPRLYRAGFDALLDVVLWRRCAAELRRNACENRLRCDARLWPEDQEDHADRVVDRLHAVWLLDRCDRLTERDRRMLHLAGERYSYRDIAAETGTSKAAVTESLRSARRKARTQIERIHTTVALVDEKRPAGVRGRAGSG